MKHNYHIRINPKKPSSEEIAGHKDFDALLRQFEATQKEEKNNKIAFLNPSIRLLLAVAAAVLVALTVWILMPSQIAAPHYSHPFIHPPLTHLKKEFVTLEIDAQQGGTIRLANGTTLQIPPDAFILPDGSPVIGKVELKYRDFQDLIDVFLSGIPMAYDSSKTQIDLATFGMLELYGTFDKQAIQIHPQKPILIELVSKTNPTNSNGQRLYRLDTVQKNWVYSGQNQSELLLNAKAQAALEAAMQQTEAVQQLALLHEKIIKLEAQKKAEFEQTNASTPLPIAPSPPRQSNPSSFVFNFDLSDYDFDDLKDYDNVLWEVSTDQKAGYEVAISDVVWEDVKIKKIDEWHYEVLLIQGGRQKVRLVITPAFKGDDYAKAKALYERQKLEYERKMTERNRQVSPQIETVDKKYARLEQNYRAEMERWQAVYRKTRQEFIQKKGLTDQVATLNRFQIGEFGIWNCEAAQFPTRKKVKVTFATEENQPIHFYMAFVADKTYNHIERFYTGQAAEISFHPESENVLWLITKDGKLAVADARQFANIRNQKSVVLKLKVFPHAIENEVVIRELLTGS